MKINEKYNLRRIAGENIVIIQGGGTADMTRIITLNDTGAWLWNELSGMDFSVSQIAGKIVAEYDTDLSSATEDAEKWTDILKKCGAIVE